MQPRIHFPSHPPLFIHSRSSDTYRYVRAKFVVDAPNLINLEHLPYVARARASNLLRNLLMPA